MKPKGTIKLELNFSDAILVQTALALTLPKYHDRMLLPELSSRAELILEQLSKRIEEYKGVKDDRSNKKENNKQRNRSKIKSRKTK